METQVYNQKAEETGKVNLPKEIFDLPWSDDLMHQVVVSMQANKRKTLAHTKGTGDVRGGGKKPWRQKGTGRARHGTKRSSLWVGGGVAHGPLKEKDYSKKINKRMKKKAFHIALSQKLRDNEILFVDNLVLTQPKTKEADVVLKLLSKIKGFEKLATKKTNKAIFALPKKDEDTIRSFNNIPGTNIQEARNLSTLDLFTYKYLVFSNPKEILEILK